jgi:hypothetical protein
MRDFAGKTETIDLKSLRLMSKKALRDGNANTSSSHTEMIAVAAAVHEGIVGSEGLPGLLHNRFERRIKRLLDSNFVGQVRPKKSILSRNHTNQSIHKELGRAWAEVIGPLYVQQTGFTISTHLNTKAVIAWVMHSIEDPASELNRRLYRFGYEHLPELSRSFRWWRDNLLR